MRAFFLVALATAILGGSILPTAASTDHPPIYYEYFEGDWDYLPDYDLETLVDYGHLYDFSLDVRYRDDQFGVRYHTCLVIYEAGYYTFYLKSDDGSRLTVNGQTVVDNDGLHSTVEHSGAIYLEPGEYPMKVEYFDAYSDQVLELNWSHYGYDYAPIPPHHLKCPPEYKPEPKHDDPSCPDLCIGRSASKLIGAGVINGNGRNQTVHRTIRKGKRSFTAVLKNLGPTTSSFRLRGLRKDSHFRIKYFDLTLGKADVTSAVGAGSYYVWDLKPGEKQVFEISVRPTGRAKFAKKELKIWFDAYSSDGRCSDRVIAKVKKVPEPRGKTVFKSFKKKKY